MTVDGSAVITSSFIESPYGTFSRAVVPLAVWTVFLFTPISEHFAGRMIFVPHPWLPHLWLAVIFANLLFFLSVFCLVKNWYFWALIVASSAPTLLLSGRLLQTSQFELPDVIRYPAGLVWLAAHAVVVLWAAVMILMGSRVKSDRFAGSSSRDIPERGHRAETWTKVG